MIANLSEKQKGILALVFLAICYGLLPVFPRYLDLSFTLLQQVYLRIFCGFIFVFLIFKKKIDLNKIKKLSLKEFATIFLRGFSYYFLGVVLFTQALLLTKISNVSFVQALPMTSILGFILLKEKFTVKKMMLIFLCFFGVSLISVKDFSTITFGEGELIALLSLFFISLGLISRRWQAKTILNDSEITLIMLFLSFLTISVASVIFGDGLPINNWSVGTLSVLIFGGLTMAAAAFFMNYGFARASAVVGGVLTSLDPLITTVLAFILFKEIPTMRELSGGLIILASAVGINYVSLKE